MFKLTTLLCSLLLTAALSAQVVTLLPPQRVNGKSIMECLHLRKSTKSFEFGKVLSAQQLSNILFAAGGINRANGKLTIPTARNLQNQSVYAVLPGQGIYLYIPRQHSLQLIRQGDFMDKIGRQSYHKDASLILIYVSNMPAIGGSAEVQASASGTHAGAAAQNVYLYAASEGLGSVICGNFDGRHLFDLLKLTDGKKVFYIQPVGFAKGQ